METQTAELDEYGYTVLPPEKVGQASVIAELRDRVTQLAARSWGVAAGDVGPGTVAAHRSYFANQMLAEGRCFEQALMNPASLALITHLLGESCALSSMSAFVKGPSDKLLDLHTDNVAIPAPFPPYSQVANSTLLLSDYSPTTAPSPSCPAATSWPATRYRARSMPTTWRWPSKRLPARWSCSTATPGTVRYRARLRGTASPSSPTSSSCTSFARRRPAT